MPVRIDPSELTSVLPPGGLTYVQGCSGESPLLADAVMAAGAALGPMIFTGIFVPGLNRRTYLANQDCRAATYFMTPELKEAGAAVEFLPLCYADMLAHLRSAKIDAALFSVSPPDETGNCSFGPVVDFLAELWPRIPTRIAHINPSLPRTNGPTGIPFEELTAFVEGDAALPESIDQSDEIARRIGEHVAAYVEDGATIQTGLGKVPGAVLRALAGRRGLRIHSGLIGDAVVDLAEAGAFADGVAVTAGVAIGTRRLYEAIQSPAYEFRPVAHTHSTPVVAGLDRFVAINSAFEVDLFGQAFAEVGPRGLVSGPGGASDFARGAKAGGGLRIVALPASAGSSTRIVASGRGPVSLGRMETDIVVTEHGAADLRYGNHGARAQALIAIAAPEHREGLARAWRDIANQFRGEARWRTTR